MYKVKDVSRFCYMLTVQSYNPWIATAGWTNGKPPTPSVLCAWQ